MPFILAWQSVGPVFVGINDDAKVPLNRGIAAFNLDCMAITPVFKSTRPIFTASSERHRQKATASLTRLHSNQLMRLG